MFFKKENFHNRVIPFLIAISGAMALSQSAFADLKKPIQFVVVESGKIGAPRCIKPGNPCFVPKGNEQVTVTSYNAKSVVGNPLAVSLVPEKRQREQLSKLLNAHVNEHVAIVVNEMLIQAPVVKAPIDTSRFELSALSSEDSNDLKKALGISGK